MSSDNKKVFTTQATSKGAGADVTSDPIAMPDGSHEHVLSVKADASCTAGVNVELEMSPDGTNWCPATTRTVSSNSTSQDPVTGNEEYVKLTPDEVEGVAEPKNKHARGGLNFDVNGAVVTPDGSGARDLMHQHIDVSKSFNYSQWFKTSENPTTTYKPVLFRHGGHDLFENLKAVQLNDTSVSDKYVESLTHVNDTGTTVGGVYEEFNNKGFFSDTTSNRDYSTDPITINFWMKIPAYYNGSSESAVFGDYYGYTFTGFTYFTSANSGLKRLNWCGMNLSNYYEKRYNIAGYGNAGDWIMVTAVINSNTIAGASIYINGQGPLGTQATGGSSSQSYPTGTITSASVMGVRTAGGAPVASNPNTHVPLSVDELSVWDAAMNSTQIGELYNSGNHLNAKSHSLSSSLMRYIKFGDATNDSESSIYCAVDSSFKLDKNSSVTGTKLLTLTSSDPTYEVAPLTQNLCEKKSGNELGLKRSAGGLRDYKATLEAGATNKNMFNNQNNDMLSWNDTWTISFYTYLHNDTNFDAIFAQVAQGTSGNRFMVYQNSSNLWVSYGGGNHYLDIPSGSIVSYQNGWAHYVIMKTASGVPSSSNIAFYANGVKLSTGTALVSSNNPLTLTQWDNLQVDEIDIYASARNIGNSSLFTYGGGLKKNTPDVLDQLAFYSAVLTDGGVAVGDPAGGQVATVYNSGNYHDLLELPSSFQLQRYFKCGDGPNDNKAGQSPKTYDLVTNELFIEPDTAYTSTKEYFEYAAEYTPGNEPSIYKENLPVLTNIFTTTSNLSISGWFKTTSGATGTLFSNTEGAATDGLKMEVNADNMALTLIDSSQTITAETDVNDDEWHHLVVTKPSGTTPTIKVYIDGSESVSTTVTTISNDDLRGGNGFTLLGDGQNNANNATASSTDTSKLQASLSNWSLHSEVLDANAVKQLYSNGHARNIKNLPNVTAGAIEAWWKLSDTTTPEEDSVGSNDLQFQEANSTPLSDPSLLVDADGAVLVEDHINGNAMTLSLTKSFNFTTNEWVSTADQDTALCLSLNGFEEQAEHVALWKCSQTIAGLSIDICDGGWHNVVLSYRGNNDLAGDNVAEGDAVKFGPGPAQSLPFNWCMSFDGQSLTSIRDGSGADYIDGLGSVLTDTYNSVSYNVGFNIYNRHLKYETSNTEEVYKPHAQFSAGIHEVSGVDNNNAFQGSVDETSFHSDCWWVDQAGTSVIQNSFNQEKPATIYGNTTALTNRGAGTGYPEGVPYPLLDPSAIGSSAGGNQYINPNRYDASTNPNGGLEGWWRWGDTPGDCSITINDVKDHDDSINARDIDAFGIVTADRQDMSTQTPAESIYNATISGSTGSVVVITFPQVIISNLQVGICNLKQMVSPILKYLRVKFTGAGSCDLGENSVQAQINFRIKE